MATFYQWLQTQLEHPNPRIRDFAWESTRDKDKPRGNASFYTWQRYLKKLNVPDLCLMGFMEAYDEYQASEGFPLRLKTAFDLFDEEFPDDGKEGYWAEMVDQNENIFTQTIDAESPQDAIKRYMDILRKWMPHAKLKLTYLENIGTGEVFKSLFDTLEARPPNASNVTLRARFKVLKRDGYRCQLCGRSAQDGIELEIDHKVPRAKNGSSKMSNLWTLCFDCNRGKSDLSL